MQFKPFSKKVGKAVSVSGPYSNTISGWVTAHIVGSVALLWIAFKNGYPLLFSDSGGYLRVGTEAHYLLDRSVVYGLMIAPLARIGGLWAIVMAQALLTSFCIGITVRTVAGRRSPMMLLLILFGLAAFSSLPWFTGQIMPDLLTALMALLIFYLLFTPYGRTLWQRWWPPVLLASFIAVHLSHLPIAAALIVIGGATAFWCRVPHSLLRIGQATLALLVALFGLCCLNLIGAHRFTPSVESNKFLIARLLDGRVAQPVLDEMCRTGTLELCAIRTKVNDLHHARLSEDYLWGDIREPLAAQDAEKIHAEEGELILRTIREKPRTVFKLALTGWLEQLTRARSADGMNRYGENMQIVRQIHIHFPASGTAFRSSREQNNTLRDMVVFPDYLLYFIILAATPAIFLYVLLRGDTMMIGLTTVVLATVLVNAAVCGILSGPFDRYQNRVTWLLPLLGALVLSRVTRGRTRNFH